MIEEPKEEEIVEPEPEPEPELPDMIEVPKEIAIIPVNLRLAVDKTYQDYKNFLFEVKMKEIQIFEAIEKYKQVREEKIEEIKEKILGDKKDDYDFVEPSGTGRPGKLIKKENLNKQTNNN